MTSKEQMKRRLNELYRPSFFFRKDIAMLFFLSFLSFFILIHIVLFFEPESKQQELYFRSTTDFFADFSNQLRYTENQNVYKPELDSIENYSTRCDRAYPPLAFFPFKILNQIIKASSLDKDKHFPQLFAILFIVLTCTSIALLFNHTLSFHYLINYWFIFGIFCSGIFLFTLERANIILLTIALISFFLFNYQSKNLILKEIALIALALAFGLKLTPVFLGGLLLYEKDWKAAVRLILYGILAFFLPFFFWKEGFSAIPDFITNLKFFTNAYFYLDQRAMAEQFGHAMNVFWRIPEIDAIQFIYCISFLFGIASLFFGFQEKIKWRRVFLFTYPILLLPHVAHRYCLCYLLPCLVIFFNEAKHNNYTFILAILFSILLSPIQISYHSHNLYSLGISLVGDIIFLIIIFSSINDNILLPIQSKTKSSITHITN